MIVKDVRAVESIEGNATIRKVLATLELMKRQGVPQDAVISIAAKDDNSGTTVIAFWQEMNS